jgi:hypothetical protein
MGLRGGLPGEVDVKRGRAHLYQSKKESGVMKMK